MPRALPTPLSSGVLQIPGDEETYVYRAYCRCGDLLYVGMTGSLYVRFAQHRRTNAPWEIRIVRIEWELYESRAVAERVEERQIRELHPVYNSTHAMRRVKPQWRPLPWPGWRDPGDTPEQRLHARARALSIGDRL